MASTREQLSAPHCQTRGAAANIYGNLTAPVSSATTCIARALAADDFGTSLRERRKNSGRSLRAIVVGAVGFVRLGDDYKATHWEPSRATLRHRTDVIGGSLLPGLVDLGACSRVQEKPFRARSGLSFAWECYGWCGWPTERPDQLAICVVGNRANRSTRSYWQG